MNKEYKVARALGDENLSRCIQDISSQGWTPEFITFCGLGQVSDEKDVISIKKVTMTLPIFVITASREIQHPSKNN